MLTGKRVLVIGLARSGKAAVKLLQKLNATITINEGKPLEQIDGYQEYLDAGIEIVAGGHPDELFERDFDFVVKNPGINYHKPFILRLKERKIPVYTEIELAYQVAKKQHYIAVTGTNGKTTTTALTGEIMKTLGCTYDEKQVGMFLWGKIPASCKDVEELTEKVLHEARVFITPGFIFGSNGARYIRISLCCKDNKLAEALERIKRI